MWKKKFGSSCTYKKLINSFEHAGYISYADSVRRIVKSIEIEAIDDECSLSTSQPETYPDPFAKPPSPSHLSPEFQLKGTSQCEQYLLVKSIDEIKHLPKGKDSISKTVQQLAIVISCILHYTGEVYTSDMLKSCKVSNVPLLRSSNAAPQEENDAKHKEVHNSDLDIERVNMTIM